MLHEKKNLISLFSINLIICSIQSIQIFKLHFLKKKKKKSLSKPKNLILRFLIYHYTYKGRLSRGRLYSPPPFFPIPFYKENTKICCPILVLSRFVFVYRIVPRKGRWIHGGRFQIRFYRISNESIFFLPS